ncbi:MAG: helix-turn-helix domain-containing protein [Alphaproteobacteria bacterium]|nr:MAG: helix-turn-helix domain-containing protein [Alphaproteobacteria bacterium]
MIGRRAEQVGAQPVSIRGFDDFELRLGDLMRGERATLGKSLLDVQRDLKIKASYIAAIENADLGAFETPGFVPGYVRSYARYLGLDPEWAYEAFCRESGFQPVSGVSGRTAGGERKTQAGRVGVRGGASTSAADEILAASPISREVGREPLLHRIEPGAIGAVFVLLALVGALGYGGWAVLQEIQRVAVAPVETSPGVVTELDPLAGAFATDTPDAEIDPVAASAAETTQQLMDRLYRPKALDLPVLVARDGPISILDPAEVGALAPHENRRLAARVTEPAPQPPAPEPAPEVKVVADAEPTVTLVAVEPAWVRVSAADGTVLLEKILSAGESFEIPPSEAPPTLRTGNAGGVYFRVGEAFYGPVGASGKVVKGLALAPEFVTEKFAAADPEAEPGLKRVAELASAATPEGTADAAEVDGD